MTRQLNDNGKNSTDLLIVILIWSFCLPEQFSFFVIDLKFYVFRVVLLMLMPSAISAYKNQEIAPKFSDALIVFALIWLFISQFITIGLDKALANGGASLIDIGLSYFVARSKITSPDRARDLMVKIGPVFLLAGLTVALEAVSGRYIVQPFASSLTGQPVNMGADISGGRLGLVRGAGPFPHAILGGLQLASLLPIFLLSNLKAKAKYLGIVAAGTSIFSVSSSVGIGIILSTFLVLFELFRDKFKIFTWNGLIISFVSVLVSAQMFLSGGVVKVIVNYLTLDKWTAYYRTLIWQYGLENVYRHPWVGMGLEDWVRPHWMTSSIDNYWLYLAVCYGVPEAVSRLGIPLVAAVLAGRALIKLDKFDRRIAIGFIIAMTMMTVMAFTVTYWGVTQAWYYFLIGCTVSVTAGGRHLSPAEQNSAGNM